MSGGDSKFIAFTLTGRWWQFNLYLTDFEGMACPRSFLLLLRDAQTLEGGTLKRGMRSLHSLQVRAATPSRQLTSLRFSTPLEGQISLSLAEKYFFCFPPPGAYSKWGAVTPSRQLTPLHPWKAKSHFPSPMLYSRHVSACPQLSMRYDNRTHAHTYQTLSLIQSTLRRHMTLRGRCFTTTLHGRGRAFVRKNNVITHSPTGWCCRAPIG